jgi:hypothetical protein
MISEKLNANIKRKQILMIKINRDKIHKASLNESMWYFLS